MMGWDRPCDTVKNGALVTQSGSNILCTFIYIVNRVVSGEIYSACKHFTLPPAVTAWTNSTPGWVSPQPLQVLVIQSFNLTTLLADRIGLLRVPSLLIRKYTRNIQLWSWRMSIEYALIERVFDTQRDDPGVTIQRWPWLALPMNTTTVQVDNQLTHRHFNASRWKKNLMGTRRRRKCQL